MPAIKRKSHAENVLSGPRLGSHGPCDIITRTKKGLPPGLVANHEEVKEPRVKKGSKEYKKPRLKSKPEPWHASRIVTFRLSKMFLINIFLGVEGCHGGFLKAKTSMDLSDTKPSLHPTTVLTRSPHDEHQLMKSQIQNCNSVNVFSFFLPPHRVHQLDFIYRYYIFTATSNWKRDHIQQEVVEVHCAGRFALKEQKDSPRVKTRHFSPQNIHEAIIIHVINGEDASKLWWAL